MAEDKKSFKLYFDQYEPTRTLPDEYKARLWDAVFQFNMGEEVHFDDPLLEALFTFFRQQFQRNDEKYAEKCRKNSENGSKGGRPSKSEVNPKKANGFSENQTKANESERKPSKAKKADNDNDNDIDNEKRKKEIPANPRFAGFVREFQNAIAAKHGATAPKVTDSLIAAGCQAMEQAERIDGFSWDEIQDALLWAMDDDFWGNNVLSLAQVRKRGANDTSKLQKVMAAYQKRKATDERPFWDRPGVL